MEFKKYKLDLVILDYLKRIYKEVTRREWDECRIRVDRRPRFIDIITKSVSSSVDSGTRLTIYNDGLILYSDDVHYMKPHRNPIGILNESQWIDPRKERPEGKDVKIYVHLEDNILYGTYAHTMYWYNLLHSSWSISPHNKDLTGWVYADSVKSII